MFENLRFQSHKQKHLAVQQSSGYWSEAVGISPLRPGPSAHWNTISPFGKKAGVDVSFFIFPCKTLPKMWGFHDFSIFLLLTPINQWHSFRFPSRTALPPPLSSKTLECQWVTGAYASEVYLVCFVFCWSTPSSMKNLFLLVKLHCIYGIYGISPSVYLFLCRWFGQYSFVLTFVRSFVRSFLPSFVLCDCRCWFFLMFFLLLTHSLTYPLRFTHHSFISQLLCLFIPWRWIVRQTIRESLHQGLERKVNW